MTHSLSHYSIEIVPHGEGRYKSIRNLKWIDVPKFAILTGKNGSGKTQLLEILAYCFSGSVPEGVAAYQALPVKVSVEGAKFSNTEVGYVPSAGRFSGGSPTSIMNLQTAQQNLFQQLQTNSYNPYDVNGTVRYNKLKELLSSIKDRPVTISNFTELFDKEIYYVSGDIDITSGIANLFLSYRIRALESIERGTPGIDREGNEIGAPPWQVVNEALTTASFPYEIDPPDGTPLLSDYEVKLRDKFDDSSIKLKDLSSGEKVIFQIVLWAFMAGKDGALPKLLLLDEPDAHLHPSMTTQFLDVISEVLVGRHDMRVIMTTHSPSTVALAPPGSVYQLERGATEVQKVQSRSGIISMLTAGLVTISKTSKFCFVEDEDDVLFYNVVREILTDFGPSRDPMALQQSPSIAFIAASVGSGSAKVPGGASVVAKWVHKLDADPLNRTFVGIIDRDLSNTPSDRIFVISRYSLENYLLDPMVLFSLLLEEGLAPNIPGLFISQGDEHLLRLKGSSELQLIADVICAAMERTDASLSSSSKQKISYTRDIDIMISDWVVKYRGHDLLPIAQKAFGGPKIINPPRLRKSLTRCRLVPKELAELLQNIQSY